MTMTLLALLISMALSGLGVLVVSRLVGGFTLRGGFGSAILVGAVYGFLKFLLAGAFTVLSLPLVVLTFGLFIVLINAILLWLTDKLMTRLTITGPGSLLLATVLLSVLDFLFRHFVGYSTFY